MNKITLEVMARAQQIKRRDPWSDVPIDHILVVHPRYQPYFDNLLREMEFGYVYGYEQLTGGRGIYFENRAPQDTFQWMARETYDELYPKDY